MKILFVVRSLYSQLHTYTTTHLAFEAQRRGHEIAYTTVNGFNLTPEGELLATVAHIEPNSFANIIQLSEALRMGMVYKKEVPVSSFDVCLLRYNPVDTDSEKDRLRNPASDFGRLMKSQGVFVINDPVGLLKASSKLYLSGFSPDIRPRTLITRSPLKIKEFIKEIRKPMIIKPLQGFGGQDVFFISSAKEMNINQIIATVSRHGYVQVQEFLPEVKKGDKRILLLNGEPIQENKKVALYRRVSPKGEIRSNIHIGGSRKKAIFSDSDRDIIDAIKSKLISDGLYFVGIDVVGDKLLEVNVACPGGIHNINELTGLNVGARVIEDLERRVRIFHMQPNIPAASSIRTLM